MVRGFFGSIFVCLLAVMATFASAGNANASWACGGGCEGSYYRTAGTGRYEFHVKDSKADGYGVMGYLRKKSNGGFIEDIYVGGGSGASKTVSRNYSAGYLTFQLCTVDGSDHVRINCADKVTVG